jgi:membrane protease YdiL (CAAX protease family)
MSLSPDNLPFGLTPDEDPGEATPEPPPVGPEPRRIPNLGHALLFVIIAAALMFGFEILLVVIGKAPVSVRQGALTVQHPILQMLSQAASYILSIALAWVIFPLLWNRSFLEGIRWNWFAARLHAVKLIGLGLLLAVLIQTLTWFTTPPKTLPIEEFFSTPAAAWGITLFGILIAPLFEEICFRGFLVPGFAIAYDFLTLSRSEEAQTHWRTTTVLTPVSMMFSAVVTSILFAWMHSQQIAGYGAALVGLFSVSLLLTIVRVRTQSVAASTLVHAAYNSFIFIVVLLQTGGYRHLDRMSH